jgi:hypothetical protein
MLVLSPRAGTLSTRIGPRLLMSLGPIVAAIGVLLLLRIGPGASFVADVVPGVTVLGLGLALLVAPLRVRNRIPDRLACVLCLVTGWRDNRWV